MNTSTVAILDFGSQTTQLIARRVRELGIYCEIFPCTVSEEVIKAFAPGAFILSGGPSSVSEIHAPALPPFILSLSLPTLGICYGMQVLVTALGGEVWPYDEKEFGRTVIQQTERHTLLDGIESPTEVWMSHGDQVKHLSQDWKILAQSLTCPVVAIAHQQKPFCAIQFHPEVTHTKEGKTLLANFLFKIAKLQATFSMASFLDEKKEAIRQQVGNSKVLLGLSGGVDSSVVAALLNEAIGEQLICVYVDHGLHRQGELEEIEHLFRDVKGIRLEIVQASERFLEALKKVEDPEQKRKIIGRIFIEVFEEKAQSLKDIRFLAQGTLYPDVIESQSFHGGPSSVIKSHHNVGGLPERMKLQLVEPLRELFKDNVRELGKLLGLPPSLVNRQPFPGPGLAVRIMGEVTKERLHLLRQADAIVREEINAVSHHLWQWFAVYLPIKTVGVMGDARTYGDTIAIRCVESTDGMTADYAQLPWEVLGRTSNRIINEVRGISRVVYDISSKPPATIEWE